MMPTFHYRPQTKLREGNVFTPVCESVHRGVSVLGDLCTVKSGRYASYWNAFLFKYLIPQVTNVQWCI